MKKNDFLGLGFCGQDFACLVPRIPIDDKVEAQACVSQGGGPSATATVTAARLGARAAFAGVVGDDTRGVEILAGLRAVGVDTAAIRVRRGGESPAAFCWSDAATGQRSIVWTRANLPPLEPAELDPQFVRETRLLHLDGHQTEAALHAAQLARAQQVTVSIDAGTLVPGMEKLLALADIVIASEAFACRYTGEPEAEAALRKLFAAPVRFAAVTLGARGSLGFDGTRLYRQPAVPVTVVDTTGAGDVFHGAFGVRYLEGADWRECLRFAAIVSALKCRRLGGRTGIPERAEVDRRLA